MRFVAANAISAGTVRDDPPQRHRPTRATHITPLVTAVNGVGAGGNLSRFARLVARLPVPM
jgi:hypothetical protein